MTDPRTPWRDPDTAALVRRRQQARARIMGWLLGALVVLIFLIAFVRIKAGHG